ncbi:MAG: hypothetical protein KBA46_01950 [Candidatus Omnitrophica bacterium]|nr:hypothetical protein [Candidatus Omnitrophota bacterium]
MKRKTVTLEKYKIHPTAQIASKARLGKGVIVGAHAIIYDNVELGDYCVVGPHVIIGEPDERFYESKAYRFSKTIIGNRALIRSGTIIYAGCSIGSFFRTGHYAVIREKTRIGDHCSFGTLAQSDGNCRIGNYVRIHYNAHICQKAIVGNFVWIYPYSILVNDLHPPCNQCK